MTVLVLDCDGVVLSGHPEGGRWDKHLKRDFGVEPERLQSLFFRRHWGRVEIGEADLFDMLDRVWPELGSPGDPRALVDYWFASGAAKDAAVLAQVDVWRAAGGKAFLGTTQEHHRAKYIWETVGLKNHFDGLLYSAELGAKKPDAEYYARAHARLPVASRDEVVFLDDLIGNVDAANAFGWRAYHFRSASDLRRALSSSASPTD